MARDDAPPFGRGESFYNGGAIDPNNLGGIQHEGKIWIFEDLDYSGRGTKPARTNRRVVCLCVRNVAAVPLLPKRLANFQKVGTDGRFFCGRVDGYAALDAQEAYPIDEFLPAAGVPVNDLFWLVIEGPAKVQTDLAGAATNVFNVGDPVIALTAASSGATTAGHVQGRNNYLSIAANQTGPNLANAVAGQVGFALSAATTAMTGADLLVDVRRW